VVQEVKSTTSIWPNSKESPTSKSRKKFAPKEIWRSTSAAAGTRKKLASACKSGLRNSTLRVEAVESREALR
jgi:hypothetical protein